MTTILFGILPDRLAAQALYYRSIPIGERAIGLGGAFTGVASDPSATYYNPAGVMRGGRFELLGSFSSIVFTRKKLVDAFDSPQVDTTFTTKRTSTLPRFIGTVVKFGRKKFGDHQFAVGFSSLEVARDNLGEGFTENDPDISLDLRVNSNYRSRWYGISFGAQVTEKSAVGFTIFLSDQGSNYNEDIGIATGGAFNDGLRVGGDSATTSISNRIQAWHFVPRLGWIHRINSLWEVGLMFQTPGIPLSQKGDVLRRETTDISPSEPTFFLLDLDDLKAKMPIPFELRAGFGFQVRPETLLSFDAAVAGPVKDKSVFAGVDVGLGAYFPPSTARRWTPNFAIGAEHKFGNIVVAGGFLTNFSAAPDVPETSNVYVPDQVNMWGGSVSVGVDMKGYRFTVGATGQYGKGDALAVTFDSETEVVSYRRTEATRSLLAFYIAGAVSVASQSAKDAKDRRKRKDKEKNHEEVEDSDTDADTDADAGTDTGAGTDAGADTGADAGTDTGAGTDAD
jgi:long-chain fatty acid transport protein